MGLKAYYTLAKINRFSLKIKITEFITGLHLSIINGKHLSLKYNLLKSLFHVEGLIERKNLLALI